MSEGEKPRVLVSSDIVGALGSLSDLLLAYSLCLPLLGPDQLAVEIIAWQHLISDAADKKWRAQEKVSVGAIHGPMLTYEGAPTFVEAGKTVLISQLMAAIPNAVEFFPQIVDENSQVPPYFLLHEPDLRKAEHASWLAHLPSGTTILVENVLERGSLAKTINRVQKLKEQGLLTGIMFDLVHHIKERTQSIKTLQTLTQEQFNSAFSTTLEEILKPFNFCPALACTYQLELTAILSLCT